MNWLLLLLRNHQAVRRTKYFEAQELLHDDGGVILPMFANYIMAHTKIGSRTKRCSQLGNGWQLIG